MKLGHPGRVFPRFFVTASGCASRAHAFEALGHIFEPRSLASDPAVLFEHFVGSA